MFRTVITGIALMAVLAGGIAGYRLGAGAWPALSATGLIKTADRANAKGKSPEATRTVLYWKHPDGDADFSPAPKKTADGRDYVPVYEDQEADFKDSQPKRAAKAEGRQPQDPLLPQSDGPRRYVAGPEEGLDGDGLHPRLRRRGRDQARRQRQPRQSAALRACARTRRRTPSACAGRSARPASPSQTNARLRIVSLRADGFIEKLYVNETGKHVKAGEPLFRVYSPQMVSGAGRLPHRAPCPAGDRERAVERCSKLRNLDVPASGDRGPAQHRASPSCRSTGRRRSTGVVMQKRVIEGQMVKAWATSCCASPISRTSG